MIKFKSGNCLSILEIVKKELEHDIVINKGLSEYLCCYFYYGLFFLYDFLYKSFPWFKFNYTWSGHIVKKLSLFISALPVFSHISHNSGMPHPASPPSSFPWPNFICDKLTFSFHFSKDLYF